MIKAVNDNKIKNNLVLGKVYIDMDTLIINPREVMLLKVGNNIIKNKYVTGADRLNFPLCGEMKIDDSHYKMVFEKDMQYIHFDGHRDFSLYSEYYTDIKNKTVRYNESTMINSINKEEFELSYDEINNIFNPYNYDGMYILNTSGDVLSAYNRKDGIIIDNKIISDDDKDKISVNNNDEFNNIVITVSNNKYEINLFRIDCIGIDIYNLSISNIKNRNIKKADIINMIEKDNYISLVIENSKNKEYKKAI